MTIVIKNHHATQTSARTAGSTLALKQKAQRCRGTSIGRSYFSSDRQSKKVLEFRVITKNEPSVSCYVNVRKIWRYYIYIITVLCISSHFLCSMYPTYLTLERYEDIIIYDVKASIRSGITSRLLWAYVAMFALAPTRPHTSGHFCFYCTLWFVHEYLLFQ